jgi:hypothetical protein
VAGPFERYASGQDGALAIPTWLLDPQSNAWLESIGQTKDFLLDRILQGVKARFPEFAPTDALDLIGQERLIPRLTDEDDDSYRARLLHAWDTWTQAGTALGLLRALYVAGYSARVLQAGKEFALDGSQNLVITNLTRPSYHPAGIAPGFWSAFDVIIGPTLPVGWPPVPAITDPAALQIFSIIKLWKPAHALCAHVIILESGWFLDIPPITFLNSTTPAIGSTVFVVWNAGF